jgi:hypothetical protein
VYKVKTLRETFKVLQNWEPELEDFGGGSLRALAYSSDTGFMG